MPPVNQVAVNTTLTNIAIRQRQNQNEFIAPKVFPRVPVQQSAGSFIKFALDMYGRAGAKPRADATESEGGTWKQGTDTYNCLPVKAFHVDIGAQLRANYPTMLALDTEATEFVDSVIMMSEEKEFADTYFKPNVWGTNRTPTVKWDDPDAQIVTDIKAAIRAVHLKGLKRPNKLVVPGKVFDYMTENADILSRVISGGNNARPAEVTKEALATVFGLDEILVAEAVEVNSPEGEAITADYTFRDGALLIHTAARPGLFTPSAGYIFDWVGYLEGKGGSRGVYKWWIQEIKADRFEEEYACDMKIVAPQLGCFFDDVLTN